ncbi:hypothetical protein L6164_016987 [Bauhinia variegata]|uniref:Uncharacterized protein n=1 Tax=Bauhinia variegata TaxID=167791 RepID=A0ACB9N6K1_BAUVA|nr:hypothetical protein L6164_016987 [Bauhinia variegata]
MEAIVNKFKEKFNKVKEDLNRWEELQSRLVSQFRNASYIIDRLQLLRNCKNYGDLNCIDGITEAVLAKQMQSLENIFVSMRKTLEKFHSIVLFLAKSDRDGRQLVKGSSSRPTMKQLQQRVGIKPRLIDCLDGLSLLHDLYYSEYQLKLSLVSALSANALKLSSSDHGALQQLLADQPNIQTEEVRFVFDIVFAEED